MRRCRIKKPVFRLAVGAGCGLLMLPAQLSHALAARGPVSHKKEARLHRAETARDPERGQQKERAVLDQAQAYLRRGEPSLAVAALEKGLAVHPRSAPLHYAAARVLAQQRDYPRARRHYEKLVKLAPGQIQGYFGLAQVAFAQRDYPASAAAL